MTRGPGSGRRGRLVVLCVLVLLLRPSSFFSSFAALASFFAFFLPAKVAMPGCQSGLDGRADLVRRAPETGRGLLAEVVEEHREPEEGEEDHEEAAHHRRPREHRESRDPNPGRLVVPRQDALFALDHRDLPVALVEVETAGNLAAALEFFHCWPPAFVHRKGKIGLRSGPGHRESVPRSEGRRPKDEGKTPSRRRLRVRSPWKLFEWSGLRRGREEDAEGSRA